jgi:hypothetical protein
MSGEVSLNIGVEVPVEQGPFTATQLQFIPNWRS